MRARLIVMMVAALLCGSAFAESPTWDELSDEQRTVLSQFQDSWDQLPEERRKRLAKGAARWGSMSPRERRQAQQHRRSGLHTRFQDCG